MDEPYEWISPKKMLGGKEHGHTAAQYFLGHASNTNTVRTPRCRPSRSRTSGDKKERVA
jgi:hypothetical protein